METFTAWPHGPELNLGFTQSTPSDGEGFFTNKSLAALLIMFSILLWQQEASNANTNKNKAMASRFASLARSSAFRGAAFCSAAMLAKMDMAHTVRIEASASCEPIECNTFNPNLFIDWKSQEDVKLDFKDVLIRPRRSTLRSRSEVDLSRNFKFKHAKCASLTRIIEAWHPEPAHATLSRSSGLRLQLVQLGKCHSRPRQLTALFRLIGSDGRAFP